MKITEQQISTAASILALGFVDDPIFSYIFPESESRLQALTALFPLFVTDGVQRGEVMIAPEDQGVIVWYPETTQVFDEQFQRQLEQVGAIAFQYGGSEAVQRLEQVGAKVGMHKMSQPHCEVLWLALVPEARGKGIGGSLLSPVLNYADTNQVGCYLVSSNPRNLTFYQRYNFQECLPIQIDTLSLTAIWREPMTN
jgi:GNAT superfamily N-acetyltransferase